ncbi:hypothetical protein SAMCCGM7_Ch0018 [Sinorhizobium americanum CCGM7]|nr:hypothetical protein SAMCCGM7_Ch0018 [Sinorhizobium americanum CCGM7]
MAPVSSCLSFIYNRQIFVNGYYGCRRKRGFRCSHSMAAWERHEEPGLGGFFIGPRDKPALPG